MKRAVVLCGGGSKGAYEVGFLSALREMQVSVQIVTGTSIGALNGCLVAQRDFHKLEELWKALDYEHVFKGITDLDLDIEELMKERKATLDFFKTYIRKKGMDVTPFYETCRELLDEEKLLKSPIDFGLCTTTFPQLKKVYITKNEMGPEIYDYLMASSACFPIFPRYTIDGIDYIDGGYTDNLPIDLAIDMGADEIIVVDMHQEPIHPHYLNKPHIIYTDPYCDLGGFMDFEPKSIARNKQVGYLTAMKAFHRYEGKHYTFKKGTSPLFTQFYYDVMKMDRAANDDDLCATLLNMNHHIILNEEDYTYLTLDLLCELCGLDDLKIHSLNDVISFLKDAFSEYKEKSYYPEKLDINEIVKRRNEFTRKGIISFIYNQLLYPERRKFEINTYTSLFPKEFLMALMLVRIEGKRDE